MTIDLRRQVERALDRNGLVEAGWTTEAIEEAMSGDYATSRFSKLEAAVVMPFIEAIARERDALREKVAAYIATVDASDELGHCPADLMVAAAQAEGDALSALRQALNTGDQS